MHFKVKKLYLTLFLLFVSFNTLNAQVTTTSQALVNTDSSTSILDIGVDISGSGKTIMIETLGDWVQKSFFGLEYWRYILFVVIIFLSSIISVFARKFIAKYAALLAGKTETEFDDMLVKEADQPMKVFFTSIGVYFAILPLRPFFNPFIAEYSARICLAIACMAIFRYLYNIIEIVDLYLRKWSKRTQTELDDTFVNIIRKTLRMILVIMGVLIIGQTILNLKITALLASVGIAGMAIAFAAQDTIANFFGSFMIALDRPFKAGDRVIISDTDGIIEQVGIRSTRIRTLAGHLVSVPNKTVADSLVENITSRPYIKRCFDIGVTYDTPVYKLEKGVSIIKEILDKHEGMNENYKPKVFFDEFKDCALNIKVITWYHPPEYWDYLAWCEKVNFRIMERFEKEGIEFAFPTTTTYLAYDQKRKLEFDISKT